MLFYSFIIKSETLEWFIIQGKSLVKYRKMGVPYVDAQNVDKMNTASSQQKRQFMNVMK